MNRHTAFGIIFLLFFSVVFLCNCRNTELSGVWFDDKFYNYWLKHPSEASPAKNVLIDSKYYLAPPNAMTISIAQSPMSISAAGGMWNIVWIKKISSNKFILKISSRTNKSATGLIYANFHTPKLMSIELGEMPIELRDEIDQSFLILDKNHNYIKCNLSDISH